MIKNFGIALLLTFSISTNASAQVVDWISNQIGYLNHSIIDPMGNVYSAGQITQPVTYNGQLYASAGMQDLIVFKHDANGALLWVFTAGGLNQDWAGDLTYDNQGNIWVTGSYEGDMQAGPFTLTNTSGTDDLYLLKIDAATGTVLFATSISAGGSQSGRSITADASGNIYFAGKTNYNGSFTWGGFTHTNGNNLDAFIGKVDNAGTPLALMSINGGGWDTFDFMEATPTGDILVTGLVTTTTTTIGGTPYNTNGDSKHIIRLDNNLNVIWTTFFNSNGNVWDLAADAAGNSYFTANSQGGLTYGTVTAPLGLGGGEITVGKLDANGNFVWVNVFGTSGSDTGESVAVDQSGNVIVVGSFDGNLTAAGTTIQSTGFKSGCVIKLDPNGNPIWVLGSRSSNSSQYFKSVKKDGDEITILGYGGNWINFGADSIGLDAGFLIRMSDNANVIQGIAYADGNNNGQMDAGENGIPNVFMRLDNGNYVTNSGAAGNYNLYTTAGAHSVDVPNLPLYHTLTTATTQSATFVGMGNVDAGNDFGLYPTPNINDLRVDITSISLPALGYVLGYSIYYKNMGTTTQTPTLTLTADGNLNHLISLPTESSINGQVLTWTLPSLAPQADGFVKVYFQIDQSSNVGDLLSSLAEITPISGDAAPNDNTSTGGNIIVAPYDPNYKSVNIDTLYPITGPSYLEYEIHFQNLGTAPAQNVVLVDTLDVDYLDLSTLEILNRSHTPLDLTIENGHIAVFTFPNIQLPDSISDPLGSMGFVKFRIKQNGTLPLNESIENFADIYFDFNPAIRTNTAITTHAQPTSSLGELAENAISLYPNPCNDFITIDLNENSGSTIIAVYDLNGRVVISPQEIINTNEGFTLETSRLNKGIYRIEIITEGTTRSKQFIRN